MVMASFRQKHVPFPFPPNHKFMHSLFNPIINWRNHFSAINKLKHLIREYSLSSSCNVCHSPITYLIHIITVISYSILLNGSQKKNDILTNLRKNN